MSQGAVDPQAMEAQIAALRKEMRRVSTQDWDLLLRQIADALAQLSNAPFIVGDLEAENRLNAILKSADMEALTERVDAFAFYITEKLAAQPGAGAVTHAPQASQSGATRRASLHSGIDNTQRSGARHRIRL